jgi:hypothetical protein
VKCKAANCCLALAVASFFSRLAAGQTASVDVVPDGDTFVRAAAPASNYGGAGALSVSGSTATNSSGVQMGLADSLMRFPMSNVVATLDSAFGGHDWVVTSAQLLVTETAAPDNALFDGGVGAFEIRWIANDNWAEGTGRPMAPTDDGVAWQDLSQILNSNTDVSLGVFTNRGADGQESFTLALSNRFVTDLRAGGELSLYLTAQSPGIGFTFNSRSFGNTTAQPALVITAAANPHPCIDSIALEGTNVAIRFKTVPDWTYSLQCVFQPPVTNARSWSNLLVLPPQPGGSNVVFLDALAQRRFYRLAVSP